MSFKRKLFFLGEVGCFFVISHVAIMANTITSLIGRERQAYITTQHMQCVDTQPSEELSHI